MLTAKKIVELQHRLIETEKEMNALVDDWLKEVPYISPGEPTTGIFNIIQLHYRLVETLAVEERKLRGGNVK